MTILRQEGQPPVALTPSAASIAINEG